MSETIIQTPSIPQADNLETFYDQATLERLDIEEKFYREKFPRKFRNVIVLINLILNIVLIALTIYLLSKFSQDSVVWYFSIALYLEMFVGIIFSYRFSQSKIFIC
jgi:hypothetical protein